MEGVRRTRMTNWEETNPALYATLGGKEPKRAIPQWVLRLLQ